MSEASNSIDDEPADEDVGWGDEFAPYLDRPEAGTDPPPIVEAEDWAAGDEVGAQVFVERRGHLVRYDHTLDRWLEWDGQRWAPDGDGAVKRHWHAVARERAHEAIEQLGRTTEAGRQALAGAQLMLRSNSRLESGLKLAAFRHPVATRSDAFDLDPNTIVVRNGTLDLQSGRLLVSQPNDMNAMLAPVVFDAVATCPRWRAFLDSVFGNDADLIEYVQTACGYTLTGHTSEQVAFLPVGPGGNGKSTFLNVLLGILGEYAVQLPPEAFEATAGAGQSAEAASPVAARLLGKRMASAVETKVGATFNEQRFKAWTGGDPIAARPLYKAPFTFLPRFTVWLGMNHLPRVRDDSHAFWRRVRIVPFNVTFREADDPLEGPRRDPDLAELLRAEVPGILGWMLEGAMRWHARGLGPIPDAVAGATTDYREGEDVLGRFTRECLALDDPKAATRASGLFRTYADWAEDNGLRPMSGTAFGRAMKDRLAGLTPGWKVDDRRDGTWYPGVRVESVVGRGGFLSGLSRVGVYREGSWETIHDRPQPTMEPAITLIQPDLGFADDRRQVEGSDRALPVQTAQQRILGWVEAYACRFDAELYRRHQSRHRRTSVGFVCDACGRPGVKA